MIDRFGDPNRNAEPDGERNGVARTGIDIGIVGKF